MGWRKRIKRLQKSAIQCTLVVALQWEGASYQLVGDFKGERRKDATWQQSETASPRLAPKLASLRLESQAQVASHIGIAFSGGHL